MGVIYEYRLNNNYKEEITEQYSPLVLGKKKQIRRIPA